MKIRSDFVTNSSSSSFLLARRGGMSEEQKKAILDYVEEHFLGEKILTPDSTEEEFEKASCDWALEDYDEDYNQAVRSAASGGCDIFAGTVRYDSCDIADVYSDIWRIMRQNADPGTFLPIKDDLGY